MNTTFVNPTECKSCGFHSFKVQGVMYNGPQNYVDIKVKCMKCGTPTTHITIKDKLSK